MTQTGMDLDADYSNTERHVNNLPRDDSISHSASFIILVTDRMTTSI